MDKYNVIGMDMETSGAYSLSYLLQIPMVSFLLATVDGESRKKLDGEERDAKERELVRLALKGMVDYAANHTTRGGE
jgi:purine-nucleoside phosphorylase